MRVLIIEDEEKSSDKLEHYLLKLDNSISILAILRSVKESVRYLENHLEPDLIFLDVQLADGESFEIFRKVSVSACIVFVTAYDQHALKAFELNTIGYLLKPFDQSDVAKAVGKYKKHRKNPSLNKESERFVVKKGNRNYIFPTQEIAYFIKDNVLYLVSQSGEKFLFESSLNKLEQSLSAVNFFRINRSCIVNYYCIESFTVESSHRYRLKLKTPADTELLVSQSRAAGFKKWVQSFH